MDAVNKRLVCGQQEKRNIPQKWLDAILNLEEFQVFQKFGSDFLKRELNQMDEIDVHIAYYFYLIEKRGLKRIILIHIIRKLINLGKNRTK